MRQNGILFQAMARLGCGPRLAGYNTTERSTITTRGLGASPSLEAQTVSFPSILSSNEPSSSLGAVVTRGGSVRANYGQGPSISSRDETGSGSYSQRSGSTGGWGRTGGSSVWPERIKQNIHDDGERALARKTVKLIPEGTIRLAPATEMTDGLMECPLQQSIPVFTHRRPREYPPKVGIRIPWRYRVRVQIAFFIAVAFSSVGPYCGLNALGGGGLSSHVTNTQLQCVYTFALSILGWLGGIALNSWGMRRCLCLAACGYFAYVLTIMLISQSLVGSGLAYTTGVILAGGAALYWSAFGFVSLRYPRPENQAATLAMIWCSATMGGCCAGLLAFFSVLHAQGAVRSNLVSYLVLCSFSASSIVISWLCIRDQHSVFHSDFDPVCARGGAATTMGVATRGQVSEAAISTIRSVLSQGFSLFGDRSLWSVWPLFGIALIHFPFLFNGLNGNFFNIRTRALNSAVYWFCRMLGGLLFYFLLRQRHGRIGSSSPRSSTRVPECKALQLLPGFYVTFLWAIVSLTMSHFCIFNSFGGLPSKPNQFGESTLDFYHDFPVSLLPMVPFVAFGALEGLTQSLCYNLIGSFSTANSNPEDTALLSGLYKSIQSITLGIAWMADWTFTKFAEDHGMPSLLRYKILWWGIALLWLAAFPGALRKLLDMRLPPAGHSGCPAECFACENAPPPDQSELALAKTSTIGRCLSQLASIANPG